MNVTIKDLAEMTNTSVATVSRVMNGKPGVKPQKREIILRVARQLGYMPNRSAKSLSGGKTNILGFITSDLINPWKVDLLRRMTLFCTEQGKQVLVANSERSLRMEKENVNIMLEHRAEGLLVFPVSEWLDQHDCHHFLELKLKRYAFTLVGKVDGYGFDYVSNDDEGAGFILARHLLELGHQRLVFMGHTPHKRRSSSNKRRGIRRALEEAGAIEPGALETAPALRDLHTENEDWLQQLEQWLNGEAPPTALVVTNSKHALEIQRPLKERGLTLPGDLSLASFDDNFWCSRTLPSMTVCAPDSEELAHQALEILMQRIAEPERPPVQRLVPMTLLARESTGPAPRSIELLAPKALA